MSVTVTVDNNRLDITLQVADGQAAANSAAASALTAATHKNDAQTAKLASEAARDDAVTAQGAAEGARDQAQTAAGEAASDRDAADAARIAAQTAAANAEDSETNAGSSADLSQAWAEGVEPGGLGTVSAKGHADAAAASALIAGDEKTAAEVARDAASGFADTAQAHHNATSILRDETTVLRNETAGLRDQTSAIKSNTESVQSAIELLRDQTQTARDAAQAAQSQALLWAESDTPPGPGSKSAKTWATESKNSADAAAGTLTEVQDEVAGLIGYVSDDELSVTIVAGPLMVISTGTEPYDHVTLELATS